MPVLLALINGYSSYFNDPISRFIVRIAVIDFVGFIRGEISKSMTETGEIDAT